MTSASEAPFPYQAVVDRLAFRPGFLANVFHLAFSGDVSAERIAAEIGCDEIRALKLAMMRTPADARDQFRQDVATIAQALQIEPGPLMNCIRRARATEALAGSDQILMAARDRFDKDTE